MGTKNDLVDDPRYWSVNDTLTPWPKSFPLWTSRGDESKPLTWWPPPLKINTSSTHKSLLEESSDLLKASRGKMRSSHQMMNLMFTFCLVNKNKCTAGRFQWLVGDWPAAWQLHRSPPLQLTSLKPWHNHTSNQVQTTSRNWCRKTSPKNN